MASIQLTWLEWGFITNGGISLISLLFSMMFYLMRVVFELCLERPGKNNLAFNSIFKSKNCKGCLETTCWSYLNIVYILEGFSNFIFAVSLCLYLALPAAFSVIHVGIAIGCSIPIIIIFVTHSCRERHVSNVYGDNEIEIEDENLKDFEVDENEEELESVPITSQDQQKKNKQQEEEEENKIEEKEIEENKQEEEKEKKNKKKFKGGCCGAGRNITCFIFEKTIGNYLESLKNGLKKKILLYCLALIFSITIVSIGIYSFNRVCACLYPVAFSTQLTRLVQGLWDPSCRKNEICFVYLNLPENPHSEMIIKFHTRSNGKDIKLYYDTVSRNNINDYSFKINCTTYDMSSYTIEEDKFVHTCDLTGLSSDTNYYFNPQVIYDYNNVTYSYNSTEKRFKTLTSNQNEIHFSNGGDYGLNSEGRNLLKQAALLSPSFFILGGDIGYANSFSSCYYRWDDFFRDVQNLLITPQGNMIPLLTCIGNHEAESALFNRKRSSAIDYIIYFSHKIGESGYSRKLYHSHNLGSHSSLIVLDSGVITNYQDQIPFINTIWNSNNKRKYAVYHAPIFPSVRSLTNTQVVSGKLHWEPIFSNFNVTIGFEHHDHLLKRTNFIKNGVVQSSGTVYVGDGSLGVRRVSPVTALPNYLVTRKEMGHFWNVKITQNQCNIEAFDQIGGSQDQLTLSL